MFKDATADSSVGTPLVLLLERLRRHLLDESKNISLALGAAVIYVFSRRNQSC